MSADTHTDINAALEASEQAIMRRQTQRAAQTGDVPNMYFGPDATFDRLGADLVVKRCHHAKLVEIPDGEYGG